MSAVTAPPPAELSLCMIVRDEAMTLARCLASVRSVVDEMIVVDTGSMDATPAIARDCGAKVHAVDWQGDFSRARNRSLELASGRWILVLDADEYLEPDDAQGLRALIQQQAGKPPDRAFQLINLSTSDGGRTGASAYIIRLFPNRPDIRYRWPIHEQVGTSLQHAGLPVENTGIVITHTGYADPERNRSKQQRNRAIFEAQLARGEDVTSMTHFLLGGCLLDLGEPAAALREYERARALALEASGEAAVAEGALVRILTCLNQLGEWGRTIAALPDSWSYAWHPELFTARAHAEAQLGRVNDARLWYERLLGCRDEPRIPACNLPTLKIVALKFLGDYWHRHGAVARAVALLRAAKALHELKHDVSPKTLAALYDATPAPAP